jgi:hypothetical protein
MRMSKALPAVSVGWSSHILGDGGAWKKIPTEAKATGSNCVGLEASLADTRSHYPGGTTVVYSPIGVQCYQQNVFDVALCLSAMA